MSERCDVCERIARTEDGENPFSVARTPTGYVNLADVQYHDGYTIFVAKTCVAELHELPPDDRSAFLEEMALVAEAVFHAFRPVKLNYELLGNSCAHLHWHLIPRHASDPKLGGPVWEDHEFLRLVWSNTGKPDDARLLSLKQRLLTSIDETDLVVEARFA